jgi:RHS repeat-associated protein
MWFGSSSDAIDQTFPNAVTLAAYNSRYPGCHFTSFTPTQEWQNQSSFGGIPSAQSRVFDMVASDASCSTHWVVQQWRNRPVGCPQYLAWNGTSCVRESIATLYSKPLSCSQCDLRDNPISLATGNKVQKESDFTAPWIDFYRTYNSSFRAPGGIGGYWTHSLNVRLIQGSAASAVVYPDGSLVVFQNGEAIDGSGAKLSYVSGEYRLESGNERYRFNSYRRAYLIERSSGDTVSIVFDSKQRIMRATHSSGRYLDFTYNGPISDDDSEIATVGDADGALITYLYDAIGRLTDVNYRDGTSRHYYYDDSNFPRGLTGIGDEAGVRYSRYEYDGNGLAVLSEHAGGVNRGVFEYRADGVTQHTDANGAIEEVQFSTAAPYRKITSISTAQGVASRSYASYSTDFRRRLSSRTDRSGNIELFSYQDRSDPALGDVSVTRSTQASGTPEQRMTETWRSRAKNQIVKRVLAGGSASYLLNARGQPLSIIKMDQASGAIRKSDFVYCEQADVDSAICPQTGLLLSSDGALPGAQNVSTFSYFPADSSGCSTQSVPCVYRKGDLWKVTDALGHVTETLAYDGAGRPLSVKDPNGITTDYEYHPRGWLTAVKVRGTDDTSETDDRITRIDYWPTGLVKQITQPDGVFTAFTYDAAHRLTDIADSAGNTLHYTLDNAGNRIKEDTKDAGGTLKRTLSRVYNQLGQLKTQATAVGDPTDFGYDANGNTTLVTDALGRKTQNEYDPLNRLSRTLQDIDGIQAETKFAYDALDNVTHVTDPKGLQTNYEYNGFGDLVKLTSPDTGVTTYTYDSAGNRSSQTDARGVTTAYTYDALNRLTQIAYPDPAEGLDISYTYDLVPSVCEAGETFLIGRLARMQDGSGSTEYCYNRFGDLVRKVQTTNGKVLVLRYAYTPGGRLQQMTYPDGAIMDYVRNTQGQTVEVGVTPSGGSRQVLLAGASYYPFGPSAGWTYGNGRILQRIYDQDYRPQAIQDTRPGGLEIGFGFDPVGNLTALTPAGNSTPDIALDYDTLGRLTAFKDGQTGSVIDGYTYDATGNRLSAQVNGTSQAYTYPGDSHRLSAVAGTARTYDASGNTTSVGGTARQYVYDATGRMSQARRSGSVTMNYRYNGRGEQVRRFLGSTNTYTLYDEAGHWLGDYDDNGAPLQQAIWLDDLPVGLLAADGQPYYIEPDHLGSPRVVIDPARDVAVWTWNLKGEAFGNTAPDQDPDGDGSAFVLDMRFPGQRYDAVAEFNQNYFRDYETGIGRYIESDRAGIADGPSTYSYVRQRPLALIDTHGNTARPGALQDFKQLAELARAEAIAKMRSCELGDCSYVPDTYNFNETDRQATLANLAMAKIEFDGSTVDCGYVESVLNPNAITIGTPTLSGRCCSLAAVIAHEAFHLGRDGRGGRGTEERARYIQQQCFGCTTAFK